MASTPKKTTRSKAKKPKKSALVEAVVITPKRLPNVLILLRYTLGVLRRNIGLFVGVVAWYTVLNVILVGGLGSGFDIAAIQSQFNNRLVGALAVYTGLVSSTSATASEAAGVYQLFLALFVSLALIWTLRQVYAGKALRVRDAYYKGLYPIVPYVLVLLIIGLQLLPMLIGTGLYELVVTTGIASHSYEIVFWILVGVGLSLVSLYLLVPSVFALLIVTLPDMTPLRAHRLARKLVAGRRWIVLRKMLFLPIVLLLISALILLPILLLIPVVTTVVLVVLSPVLITLAHGYIYTLYRELTDD